MIFTNREQAAELLAERLTNYKGSNPLVFAIPRGAVPMAKIIAEALGGELDVVLVRKLGAPGNPEFALGAVEESGWAYLGEYAAFAGIDEAGIERVKQYELETIRRRRAQYSPLRTARDPKGRVAIVVDDGLATGATMMVALHALRAKHAAKLICAVPVSPPDTAQKIAKYCDELVCLHTSENFRAVGQFYRDFRQVEDEEVVKLLGRSN